MKRIPLTRGKVALVSAQDYWLVRQFKWSAQKSCRSWYAITTQPGARPKRISMHRLIAGFPPFALDHRNCNGVDNQRGNLRPADARQNQGNSRRALNNTSGFKGVHWHKQGNCWQARISKHGKRVSLGLFYSARLAHAAYMRAACNVFGEFARAS